MCLPRNLYITLFAIAIIAPSLFAATWHERFAEDLRKGHIDDAVRNAVLEEKKTPVEIIQTALQVGAIKSDDQKRKHLVKALFCTIAYPEQVQSAALQNGFSEQEIWQGYQWAIDECRRQLEEWYNFAPSEEGRPSGKASPWNFQ